MLRQPRLHFLRLVSSVVVADRVHVEVLGDTPIDLLEKAQELLGAMPWQAFADHLAGFRVIMQRLHDADVSGDILAREANYCHMLVPMYFDPMRYPASEDGERI